MSMRNRSDAQATRRSLVEAAARRIHQQGFQAASLDAILAETGVSKGALYHHFANKHELGLAVLREVYQEAALADWRILAEAPRPLDALQELLAARRAGLSLCAVEHGCPLNNLAQELAGVDEPFRAALEEVLETWRSLVADALERARREGQLRAETDCRAEAVFLVSLIEGATGSAKTARDPALLDTSLAVLARHLDGLRPTVPPSPKEKP